MKKNREFPFSRARKIKASELRTFRKAYASTFGKEPLKRGRPPKGAAKYRDIHIKLHPEALRWARARAKQCGIGYQTVINEVLLSRATLLRERK